MIARKRKESDGNMKKKRLVLAGLLIALMASVAYGAVLTYYGRYVTTADVHQSVWVDGQENAPTIADKFDGALGGETFCFKHWLHNHASVPAKVTFATSYSPGLVDAEIVTTYWLPTGYNETFSVTNATVTVEDLGCSVKWTIDMTEPTDLYQSPFKNGHAAVGLVIGVGDDIKYQVHSNDGTCSAFAWGTWLFSFYDPTGGGGWHTSEADWNTPVDTMAEVNATGKRDLVDNADLFYTITIAKRLLSCGTFKWSLVLIGDVTFAKIKPTYEWSDTDTTHFETAVVGTQIVGPLLLLPSKDVHFIICYSFRIDIYPGVYTITTRVLPA